MKKKFLIAKNKIIRYCPECKTAIPKKNKNVKFVSQECRIHQPNFISTGKTIMVRSEFFEIFTFMTTTPVVNYYQ